MGDVLSTAEEHAGRDRRAEGGDSTVRDDVWWWAGARTARERWKCGAWSRSSDAGNAGYGDGYARHECDDAADDGFRDGPVDYGLWRVHADAAATAAGHGYGYGRTSTRWRFRR